MALLSLLLLLFLIALTTRFMVRRRDPHHLFAFELWDRFDSAGRTFVHMHNHKGHEGSQSLIY